MGGLSVFEPGIARCLCFDAQAGLAHRNVGREEDLFEAGKACDADDRRIRRGAAGILHALGNRSDDDSDDTAARGGEATDWRLRVSVLHDCVRAVEVFAAVSRLGLSIDSRRQKFGLQIPNELVFFHFLSYEFARVNSSGPKKTHAGKTAPVGSPINWPFFTIYFRSLSPCASRRRRALLAASRPRFRLEGQLSRDPLVAL